MTTQIKKRTPIVWLVIISTIALCVVCVIISNVMDSMGMIPTQLPTSQPTQTIQQPSPVPTSIASKYLKEYGGSEAAYLEILTSTDCAFLQEKFNTASNNNAREQAGTEAFSWTLGYMTAANEHMKELGCYE